MASNFQWRSAEHKRSQQSHRQTQAMYTRSACPRLCHSLGLHNETDGTSPVPPPQGTEGPTLGGGMTRTRTLCAPIPGVLISGPLCPLAQMLRAQLASKEELLCAGIGPQGPGAGAETSHNRATGDLRPRQSRGLHRKLSSRLPGAMLCFRWRGPQESSDEPGPGCGGEPARSPCLRGSVWPGLLTP